MPTYNRASFFLPRAIQSVLNQTYENFQLIIGDNASTDNTEEVVKSFNDSRITYIKSKSNTGTQNTFFNAGLKYETKYTSFIEDDDRYYPLHIEKLVSKAKEGFKAVYCFGINILYDGNGNIPLAGQTRCKEWNKNWFIFGGSYFNWIDQSDILVDREALLSVGGFREDANFQDYAIMAKMCMRYEVGCVAEILTECAIDVNKYGQHAENKWRNSDTLLNHIDIF